MGVKPIETVYKGYRFRSRLEARWAVFFDSLGIEWEFEKEGFIVRDAWAMNEEAGTEAEKSNSRTWSYLPDFYLPKLGTWVEVKGEIESVDDDYLEMIANCIDWGGALPGISESLSTSRGLLWLGPIPSENAIVQGIPAHVIIQHGKGGWVNYCHFTPGGGIESEASVSEYFDTTWGGVSSGEVIRKSLTEAVYGSGWIDKSIPCPTKVRNAYKAARSARFEHGEKGAPR